jgi:WD40 repeat protein
MDRDLRDDMLKLVRYKVLFVKREYEHAFPEREDLVSENMDGAAFTAWKVAEFIQELRLGETRVPEKWRKYGGGRYVEEHGAEGGVGAPRWLALTDPREKFKYEEQQIRVLEEIREGLRNRGGGSQPRSNSGAAGMGTGAGTSTDAATGTGTSGGAGEAAGGGSAAGAGADVEVVEPGGAVAETEPDSKEPGSLRRTINAHDKQVNSVAFAPDGLTFASGSADATVKLWDARTGAERVVNRAVVEGVPREVTSVAFSPDGSLLARGHHANTVEVLAFDGGALDPKLELVGHEGWVPVVTFSPDGKWVATASLDLTARVWDAETGETLVTLKGHDDTPSKLAVGVWGVAFSPDGKRVATGASDAAVVVWDAKTGEEQKTFRSHAKLVFSVAFAPDGATLASAGYDGTVRLWDVAQGKERRVLKVDDAPVHYVAFSPDGRTLAAAGGDGSVRLWNL